MKLVTVSAHSRLHITLIDTGIATARVFGGAGFAIAGADVVIEAFTQKRLIVENIAGVDQSFVEAVATVARTAAGRRAVGIRILSAPPQHVGFGTKTSGLLGAALATRAALGLSHETADLQALTGRGGASGIGINSFFVGGLIVDGGHKRAGQDPLPSSAVTPIGVPPVFSRCDIPPEWRIMLVLAKGIHRSGEREKLFFRANTPVPKSEVLITLAAVYHGVLPAVVERSIDGLASALAIIHSCGFKQRELKSQTPNIQTLYSQLSAIRGCAVGMSSMGPLLYVVGDAGTPWSDVTAVATEADAQIVLSSGANDSYAITYS
ncbi:MAG: beta-ribofuranosylaminobenzene 5'-phosphate synthase family protein [Acidobacteriota bacterium]